MTQTWRVVGKPEGLEFPPFPSPSDREIINERKTAAGNSRRIQVDEIRLFWLRSWRMLRSLVMCAEERGQKMDHFNERISRTILGLWFAPSAEKISVLVYIHPPSCAFTWRVCVKVAFYIWREKDAYYVGRDVHLHYLVVKLSNFVSFALTMGGCHTQGMLYAVRRVNWLKIVGRENYILKIEELLFFIGTRFRNFQHVK